MKNKRLTQPTCPQCRAKIREREREEIVIQMIVSQPGITTEEICERIGLTKRRQVMDILRILGNGGKYMIHRVPHGNGRPWMRGSWHPMTKATAKIQTLMFIDKCDKDVCWQCWKAQTNVGD